jgi:hypothetical protein
VEYQPQPVSKDKQYIKIVKQRLLSFYEISGKLFSADKTFNLYKQYNMAETNTKKVELFLDSGAFSAWSQGKEIDIQDYIAFIKEHKDVITTYANLDVIGDPAATWKNQMIMEDAGLLPLPVFHYGEDIKWLQRILKRNYEYISLGGMVPISTGDLIHWLDDLFTHYLCDSDGMPIVKVHGFGLTSLRLMLRYNWWSVDSTSWVLTGRMGSIYIPKFRNGKWLYDEDSWKVSVSNKSPNDKEKGKHIQTMSPMEKKILLEYISSKGYKLGTSKYKWESQDYELKENERWVGSKPADKTAKREVEIIVEAGVSNEYKLRDELNIIYFLDLEASLPEWPWKFKLENSQKGMF